MNTNRYTVNGIYGYLLNVYGYLKNTLLFKEPVYNLYDTVYHVQEGTKPAAGGKFGEGRRDCGY